VYQLSRSLYRELGAMLPTSVDELESRGRRDRQFLLEACENAVRRLALEPETCANPSRSLFREIRHLFPVDAQIDVWRVVSYHVEAGRILSDRIQETLKRECQAVTRSGDPCRREPRAGMRYCPSHYGLAEDLLGRPRAEVAPA
jgi:hypothetical protein